MESLSEPTQVPVLEVLDRRSCLEGRVLTFLDDLLRLLPDTGVAEKPPLSLLADLALQVVLFWNL